MFDLMFNIMPVFFILVAGIIIVALLKGVAQWNTNNQSPKLTVDALIISRRSSVSYHQSMVDTTTPMMTSSTTYYITFQVQSGDRLEFHVSGKEYGMLAEGDQGQLTFQGTRYIQFSRNRIN